MSNAVAGEISPAQNTASTMLHIAIAIWAICAWIWLWMFTALSGSVVAAIVNTVIAFVIFMLALYNGSSFSPVSAFFNEILERGGGYPKVSMVMSILMTLAVAASLIWYPAAWAFWTVLGVCVGSGVPFSENITYRFD